MADTEGIVDSPLTETNGPTFIGIIRNGACPNAGPTLPTLNIVLDNENRRNGNSATGWIGDTHWQTNISFAFCSASSSGSVDQAQPYIVLQLQPGVCPPGSQHLMRHFDTENTSPNISSANITSVVVDGNHNVDVSFCAFSGGAQSAPPFPAYAAGPLPSFSVSYGVFARSDFARALESGGVFSDDEDSSNNNFWQDPGGTNAYAILNGIDNTELNMVRVR
jgi:hypothetical protein